MKRLIVLTTLVAVAAVPVAAEAGAPKTTKRTLTWSYTGLHGVTTPAASTGFENPCTVNPSACYSVTTTAKEKLVSFVPSSKVAIQYFTGDNYDGVTTTCGSGTVPVSGGSKVSFYVVADPSCAGAPTTGTVAITVTGTK